MKKTLIFLFILLAGLSATAGLSAKDGKTPPVALLFNVPPLLTDAYSRWGFGAQISLAQWQLRFMAGLYIDVDEKTKDNQGDFIDYNEYDDFDFRIGFSAAYRFGEERVSPYLGLGTYFSRNSNKGVTDKDNWVETYGSYFSLGPLVGVEIMIMENFGIFAEYQLSANFSKKGVTTSSGGDTTTEEGDLEWSIGLDIANESSLGLVIYLP